MNMEEMDFQPRATPFGFAMITLGFGAMFALMLTGAIAQFGRKDLVGTGLLGCMALIWPPAYLAMLPMCLAGRRFRLSDEGFSYRTLRGWKLRTWDSVTTALFLKVTMGPCSLQLGWGPGPPRLWRSISIPLYSFGKPLTLIAEIERRLSVPVRGMAHAWSWFTE
jgi:hypothetical protein